MSRNKLLAQKMYKNDYGCVKWGRMRKAEVGILMQVADCICISCILRHPTDRASFSNQMQDSNSNMQTRISQASPQGGFMGLEKSYSLIRDCSGLKVPSGG